MQTIHTKLGVWDLQWVAPWCAHQRAGGISWIGASRRIQTHPDASEGLG